jgi:hypothetical protein
MYLRITLVSFRSYYSIGSHLAQAWANNGVAKYRESCESSASQLLDVISTSVRLLWSGVFVAVWYGCAVALDIAQALAAAPDAATVYRYLAVVGSLVCAFSVRIGLHDY